ncbi:hypothetical protein ACL2XQ_09615 [Sodalis sp. RH14]|uniref:hypothetical protein n=1 Tax=Sodalis sp. RH14 TaxID=3394329 RepID=UPI0039B3FBA1
MKYKIAVVDDDFSDEITESDLRRVDNNDLIDQLEDSTSQEYEDLTTKLTILGLDFHSLDDVVRYINDSEISTSLPPEIQQLKTEALSRKTLLIAPVISIMKWLCDANLGITDIDIDRFACPENFLTKDNLSYDLILVDYLLVNDSESQTIPFIKTIKERIENLGTIPSFILMSSYSGKISENFLEIKSELEMTSSRFRIMEKPTLATGGNEETWKATFKQIFEQKYLVKHIESFINNWILHFESATKNLSKTLWALDAHNIDVMRRTALEDSMSLSDYFSEIIFKKVLAEFENSLDDHQQHVRLLGNDLEMALKSDQLISPGNEVQDSRNVLKMLLKDSSWHEENWFKILGNFPLSNFTAYDLPALYNYQFNWIKRNLRFGTVLRNKKNRNLLINLTQPCDIAHLKNNKMDGVNLLLMHGNDIHMSMRENSSYKTAISTAIFLDSSWRNINWDLSRPFTPSIFSFINVFEEYEIIGQHRSEQTQYILNRYVAKISRVATIRIPNLFDLKFLIAGSNEQGELKIFNSGEGHAISSSTVIINFSPDQATLIVSTLDLHGDVFDRLVSGVSIPNKNKLRLTQDSPSDNLYFLKDCFSEPEATHVIEEIHLGNLIKNKIKVLFIYLG